MRRYVTIAILVAISTYLVHLGLMHAGLFPLEASAQAVPIDQLFYVHLWIISFLFSLIMVTLIYSLIAFHRRKGEEGDGAYLTGNTPLEITWTSIPLMAVLALAYVGAQTLGDIRVVDPSALTVDVTAGQWFWQFIYPDYTIASNELYLPLGRQANLQMTSIDVIHSFWVPEFRVKQDVVPGRTNEIRFTPTLIGSYQVRCSELCGLRHAYMEAAVHVVSQADFDSWVKKQQANAPATPELKGQLLATQYGCANCHSTDGTVKTGPTWQHLYGSQVKLADGSTVTADDNYIKNSIEKPHSQVVAGFPDVMPDFGTVLKPDQVNDLLAYIKSLK